MSYLCQECKKNGGHRLHFRDKAWGKLPDFEKLVHIHVIQHGLQGFIIKNIEGGSMEESGLSHILYK